MSRRNHQRSVSFCSKTIMGSIIALVLAISPGTVHAQISDSIMDSPGNLSAAQRQVVRTFTAEAVAELADVDSRKSRSASRQLISKVSRSSSSRAFRLAYAEELIPDLTLLVNSDDAAIHARLGAMSILGSLATDDASAVLIEKLKSDKATVRYTAATGLHRSFDAIGASRHAFADQVIASRNMLRALRAAAGKERNPFVANAELEACAASTNLGTALVSICNSLKDQFKAMDAGEVPATMAPVYKRSLQSALNLYIRMLGSTGNMRDQQQAMIEVGYMAMKAGINVAKRDEIPDSQLGEFADLVKASEGALDVLCNLQTDRRYTQENRKSVSTAFGAGKYEDADTAIQRFWLTPSGPIYGNASFGFSQGSFDRLFD